MHTFLSFNKFWQSFTGKTKINPVNVVAHRFIQVFSRPRRTVWREIVGEGNIDVSAPKGSRKDQRLYLVQYLGKYLVKAFATGDRKLNKHRFRSSRNIAVPTECFTVPIPSERKIEDIALDKLKEASGGSVGFVWDGEGMLAGWACSWK